MDESDLLVRARLSAQRALLGEVPPAMRAAVLAVDAGVIELRCYFDGPIQEEDAASVSVVETQMMADFDPEKSVSACCIRLDAPTPVPDEGMWVYSRREPSIG